MAALHARWPAAAASDSGARRVRGRPGRAPVAVIRAFRDQRAQGEEGKDASPSQRSIDSITSGAPQLLLLQLACCCTPGAGLRVGPGGAWFLRFVHGCAERGVGTSGVPMLAPLPNPPSQPPPRPPTLRLPQHTLLHAAESFTSGASTRGGPMVVSFDGKPGEAGGAQAPAHHLGLCRGQPAACVHITKPLPCQARRMQLRGRGCFVGDVAHLPHTLLPCSTCRVGASAALGSQLPGLPQWVTTSGMA